MFIIKKQFSREYHMILNGQFHTEVKRYIYNQPANKLTKQTGQEL